MTTIEPEIPPNQMGKVPVTVTTSTGEEVTIHVPEGHGDYSVRYEDAAGVKHEWINPDAVAPVIDPTPDDDVIWDAARQAYVPRVTHVVAEGGAAVEGQAPTPG